MTFGSWRGRLWGVVRYGSNNFLGQLNRIFCVRVFNYLLRVASHQDNLLLKVLVFLLVHRRYIKMLHRVTLLNPGHTFCLVFVLIREALHTFCAHHSCLLLHDSILATLPLLCL